MNKIQTSETFALSALLALSGGFQDAYTYIIRNKVFSNAQTGNIVLMSQQLILGNISGFLHYLLPVVFFALGILIAEQVSYRHKKNTRLHWRQIIVFMELVILFVVGFMPHTQDALAAALVSFACALQVQSFRKVHGYSYASTMCIGNLRSGMESLSVYIHSKNKEALKKAMHYYGIIFFFAIGAGCGCLVSDFVGIPAIWISCTLLLAVIIMMIKDYR